MITISDSIINQMTECIVKEVNPVRIILFGSIARGHVHEGSDVDLLVIEDAPFGEGRSRFRETGRINRALAGFGVAAVTDSYHLVSRNASRSGLLAPVLLGDDRQ